MDSKEEISTAYEEVRNDGNEINWLLVGYEEDNSLHVTDTGTEYDDLLSKFTESERLFAYARISTGDEMSRRVKFVFITWCGSEIGPLKRAKMSTDKQEVKAIVQSFAVELQTNELEELQLEAVKEALTKAGGANYGTGSRD